MNKKQKQILVALGVGALALLGNKLYLDAEREALLPQNSLTVVTTKESIRAGTRLANSMIKEAKVPSKYLPKTAIRWSERDNYIGQEVSVDVPSSEYVLQTYFLERATVGQTLSAQISGDNMRAITIPVDELNSLSRSIVAGDKIDIIFTFSVPSISAKVSAILLQNVSVISTGSYSVAEQELGTRGGQSDRYSSLTLLLNADDAFRLNYARQLGAINVVLRNSSDSGQLDLVPVSGYIDLLSASDREKVEKAVVAHSKFTDPTQSEFKDQLKEIFKQKQQQDLLKK